MNDLLDPMGRINPAATVAPVKSGTRPTFYECGCCGALHNARWDGDCRQDNARFFADQLDECHGANGWDEIDMDDVDDWRERQV